MMLYKLSDELLRKIVQRLSARTKDLRRLCLVSRRISGLAIPVLYQDISATRNTFAWPPLSMTGSVTGVSLGGFTFDGNRQPSTDHGFGLSIPWQALFKIVNQVSHQLAELDIDLEQAVQNPRCIFHYPMFSTWLEMLQSRPPAHKPRPSNIPVFFPALGSLLLSFVDLAGIDATIQGRPGILDAFEFSAIKQLKLRCCPRWELLLQYLTQNLNRPKYEYWDRVEKKMRQQPPFDPYNPKYTPLKSLEISYSHYPEA
ncbi:hypothetical protein V8F33_004645 [Rhypophila sp. PSN 637]